MTPITETEVTKLLSEVGLIGPEYTPEGNQWSWPKIQELTRRLQAALQQSGEIK